MTDYAQLSEPNPLTARMENQDTAVKAPPRPDASKTTLPQPGRPVPSRAYPGALIVVEGTDGSGKSTQLYLLKRWLEIGGYRLHFTEWNSSPLVKSATRRGKQRRLLTPTTFSLLHAADFADRCERQIMPLLQGDYLVLADRYIYTAFPRASGRGGEPHSERTPQAEILRSRHGPGTVLRPGRKFSLVPGANSRGVRQDGRFRQFRGARRDDASE